ncbi:hypothetical protein JFT91_23370 [Pseudomonas sp. TH08]|uniref:Imm50 family immunity protein n=1 Tax=Pseudomonas sp. TH06 TaxID=2796372 RepID=UPI0019122BB4|nr:Imm50 family immunity protein [Pseudomonas sp. TH06]MBK5530635.1 hypothetical protein [Pseudomonas sp. TH06]MBK5535479.1 hypothetical protein [Pseudomonas sp. TH08]
MKYWNDIEGSKFFNIVFSTDIEIGEIKLFALNVDNNLSNLTLAFDIKDLPDRPPTKWQSIKYNACRIGITFGDIQYLTVTKIPAKENLTLSINKVDDKYLISAISSTSEITFTASSLRLRDPSVYLTTTPF